MPRTPVEPVARSPEESREDRRHRAVEEPLDVRARDGLPFPAFDVRNPVRGTRYLAVAPAFPSREGALCTCTDFARRGIGTCKHLEAVWIWLAEHPEFRAPPRPTPATVSWAEIDRWAAPGGVGGTGLPRSVRYRKAGGLLFRPV